MLTQHSPESALRVFAAPARGPRATMPVVMVSVTVAAVSMHADGVSTYSSEAFGAGIVLAAVLAWSVAAAIARVREPSWRAPLALLLPTIAGAIIGVVVQAFVLSAMAHREPLRDLEGAIDTMHPLGWLVGGVILGGLPALAVSLFVALAARALRRLSALDASEHFTVVFTGFAGVFAAFSTLLVSTAESTPLFLLALVAFGAVGVTLLVDGARLRTLRHAFAGAASGYEIVAADRFQSHRLASLVETAPNAGRVLVRIDPRPDYRQVAAEPIALVGSDELATCGPIARRRFGAGLLMFGMAFFGLLGAISHGLFM